jgi:hypothetical protein
MGVFGQHQYQVGSLKLFRHAGPSQLHYEAIVPEQRLRSRQIAIWLLERGQRAGMFSFRSTRVSSHISDSSGNPTKGWSCPILCILGRQSRLRSILYMVSICPIQIQWERRTLAGFFRLVDDDLAEPWHEL